jgi:chromosome segregation ATPase
MQTNPSGSSSDAIQAAPARLPMAPLIQLRALQSQLGDARIALDFAVARLEKLAVNSEQERRLRRQLENDLNEARESNARLEKAAQIGQEHAKNAEWLLAQRLQLLSRVEELEQQIAAAAREMEHAQRDRAELERCADIGKEHAKNAEWLLRQRDQLLLRATLAEDEKAAASAELTDAQRQLAEAQRVREDLEAQIHASRAVAADKEHLLRERTELLARTADLELRISALQQRATSAEEQATAVSARLISLLEERDRGLVERINLERALSRARGNAKEAERLVEERDALLLRVSDLAEQISAFETRIVQSEQEKTDLIVRLQEASKEIHAAQEERAEFERQVQLGRESAKAAARLASQRTKLLLRLAYQEEQLHALDVRALAAENKAVALAEVVTKTTRELHGVQSALERAVSEASKARRELAENRDLAAELEQRIHSLYGRIAELTIRLDEAESARQSSLHAIEAERTETENVRLQWAAETQAARFRAQALAQEIEVLRLKLSEETSRASAAELRAGRAEVDVQLASSELQHAQSLLRAQETQTISERQRGDALRQQVEALQHDQSTLSRQSSRIMATLAETARSLAQERSLSAYYRHEVEQWVLECEQLLCASDEREQLLAAAKKQVVASHAREDGLLQQLAEIRADLEKESLRAVAAERKAVELTSRCDTSSAAQRELHAKYESLQNTLREKAESFERELRAQTGALEHQLAVERRQSAQHKLAYERSMEALTGKFEEFVQMQLTRTRADIAAMSAAIDRVQGGRIWQIKRLMLRIFRKSRSTSREE